MLLAVLMGCIGNLMATFITVLGGYGLLIVTGYYGKMSLALIITLMAVFAILRGILRYAEQACNHFIAFKLLARIRHQVFAALRKLAPAKLDGSEKGNLISIITSDIELLEVFYAHTISPIAIAVITSVVMCVYLGSMSAWFAVIAACFYVLVGVVIPLWNGKRGSAYGKNYRDSFGKLNTTVLDNLYGLEETIQYERQGERMKVMSEQTDALERVNRTLKNQEKTQRILTDWVILASGVVMACAGSYLTERAAIAGYQAVTAVIAMMSSFGPTAALSALSNNLNQTLACGNRVLNLLEEEPAVCDVEVGTEFVSGDITCEQVDFSYGKEPILSDFTQVFAKKQNSRNSRKERLWQIYVIKASHAFLRDGRWKHPLWSGQCQCDQHGISAETYRLRDAGDIFIPRYDRKQYQSCKGRRNARGSDRGGKKSVCPRVYLLPAKWI